MLRNLKNTILFITSSAFLFTACGDDPADDPVDAGVNIDSAVDIDAGPDTTFSGTLSLAEITVTNPIGVQLGLSGAVVNVGFTDPADVTVAPAPGYENNVGACRITVFDIAGGDVPAGGSDGGAVTVSGTNAGEFVCNYNGGLDTYLCASTASGASGTLTVAATQATPGQDAGTVLLTMGGIDLGSFDPTGGSIVLSGFDDDNANGRFPVLLKLSANSIVIGNRDLLGTSVITADQPYSTFVGTGPVPGGYDFLDDGTNDVTFAKDAITDVPVVDTTLTANGEGFALAAGSALPHAIPTDGSAVTFSCDDADGGNCGVQNGLLKGIIVFGSTTDGVISADPTKFSEMPDPVNSFATFQCSGIGLKSIPLSAGAMTLIMGTNPTRIQTSVTYANAALSGKNTLVVSHGVVGFTDVVSTSN